MLTFKLLKVCIHRKKTLLSKKLSNFFWQGVGSVGVPIRQNWHASVSSYLLKDQENSTVKIHDFMEIKVLGISLKGRKIIPKFYQTKTQSQAHPSHSFWKKNQNL